LLKHVGQSEQALMGRLASESKISGSSSFYDRALAERSMSEALEANSSKISKWLSGSNSRLPIEYTAPYSLGISVPRGATNAVDASSLKAILIRDSSLTTGFRIQTGYPTKP
jgi:filamentous hemagglutinin